MSRRHAAIVLVILFGWGCNQDMTNSPPVSPAEAEAQLPEAQLPETQAVMPAPTERVKAAAGVAKKGRSLDDVKGVGAVIAQPAKALFSFEEKAVFDIQIPQAMQLFNAVQGRKPKSHEEFMSQIIKANRIQLPELPDGQRYEFDPDRGELMVVRPK